MESEWVRRKRFLKILGEAKAFQQMARHPERQKERDNLARFRGTAAVHAGGAGSACNLQGRRGEREEVEAVGRPCS